VLSLRELDASGHYSVSWYAVCIMRGCLYTLDEQGVVICRFLDLERTQQELVMGLCIYYISRRQCKAEQQEAI
jgi:hypothetical protein